MESPHHDYYHFCGAPNFMGNAKAFCLVTSNSTQIDSGIHYHKRHRCQIIIPAHTDLFLMAYLLKNYYHYCACVWVDSVVLCGFVCGYVTTYMAENIIFPHSGANTNTTISIHEYDSFRLIQLSISIFRTPLSWSAYNIYICFHWIRFGSSLLHAILPKRI